MISYSSSTSSPGHRSFENRKNWKNYVHGKIAKVTYNLEKEEEQLKDEGAAYREELLQYYKLAVCVTKLKSFNKSDKKNFMYIARNNEFQYEWRKTDEAIYARYQLTDKILKTSKANMKLLRDLIKCARKDQSFLLVVKALADKYLRLFRRWKKQTDKAAIDWSSKGCQFCLYAAGKRGQRLQRGNGTCKLHQLSWRDLYRKCMMK